MDMMEKYGDSLGKDVEKIKRSKQRAEAESRRDNERKFKKSEQAGRLEKEILKLQESYSRHKGKETSLASSISSKIQQKTAELNKINAASKNLSKEEGSRKSKSKLSIF